MATELFGVEGDDLVEAGGVVGAWFGVVERGAGEPHVGAGVGIGLGSAGVEEAAHEGEFFAEGFERGGGVSEDELAVLFECGEPAPIADIIFSAREGHAVGGIDGAEAAGGHVRDIGTHGVEDGEGKGDAPGTFEERAAV